MLKISIRQPWASLIVEGKAIVGVNKDIENRDWCRSYRGPLQIHASKRMDMDAFSWLRNQGFVIADYVYPCGCLIGAVTLTDIVTRSTSVWFEGTYGFVLENPSSFPPIPMKGKVGLF